MMRHHSNQVSDAKAAMQAKKLTWLPSVCCLLMPLVSSQTKHTATRTACFGFLAVCAVTGTFMTFLFTLAHIIELTSRPRPPLDEIFVSCQDAMSALRGPLIIAAFLCGRKHWPALQTSISSAAYFTLRTKKCADSFTKSRTLRYLPNIVGCGVMLLGWLWDFLTWFQGGKIDISRWEQPTVMLSQFGIHVPLRSYYLLWFFCGIIPYFVSVTIQVVFFTYGMIVWFCVRFLNRAVQNTKIPLVREHSALVEIDDLLKLYAQIRKAMAEFNRCFSWVLTAGFALDTGIMLSCVADFQSRNPLNDHFVSVIGIGTFGLSTVVFSVPALLAETEGTTLHLSACELRERAVPVIQLETGYPVKVLLAAFCRSTKKFKLTVYLGSSVPLGPGLILKAFALLATVSVIAGNLFHNDELQRCPSSVTNHTDT